MATQNFRVKNGLEVGIGVTIDGTSGIITASSYDGNLNALGKTYYVATTGSDTNSGNNINEPYLTIAKALSVATNGDIVNVSAGTYEETCPLTVPRGVTVKGAGLRATTIRPTDGTKTNDVFRLNDVTTVEDFTIRGSYFDTNADTGYSFTYAPGIAITTRSPYIQRVTVLNFGSVVSATDPYGYDSGNSPPSSYIAGAGAKVDGSLVASNSLEAGMLFNEATFFTPNSKGIVLTNGARAEYLNCFHYFASQAIVGTSGTVGIAGTANARLKFTGINTTPIANDVVKLYEGGSVVAIGTIVTYDDPYARISGKGSGTFTSAVGIGSTQDVRFYQSDGTTQTGIASAISLADYTMFGAEMRSVGCAVEYGVEGVVADGVGVQLRLFATNFNHVGSGKDFSNDPTTVIQSNEVLESNGGQVSYVSIDQSGDFRVGDALYINQETGQVSFASTTYDLENIGNFSVTDGVSNQTLITPTSLTVGNLQLAANTFSSTSGDINIDPSGSSETNVTGNLNVSGILTASVIQVSALQKGDTSVALDDTGSNGTIRLNTDGSEALRITNNQNVLIGDTTETGTSSQPLQVTGGAYISGNVGIGTDNPQNKLDVRGDIRLQDSIPEILFRSPDGSSNQYYIGANISDSVDGGFRIGEGSGISGGTSRISISNSGNIGIGTDTPGAALEVTGDIRVSANSGSYRTIGAADSSDTTLLLKSGAASGTGGNIELGRDQTNYYDANIHQFRNVSAGTEYARLNGSGNLLISNTTDTGTASQKLQVTGGAYVSGNVGINSTIPTEKLDVGGNGKFSGNLIASEFSTGSGNLGFTTNTISGPTEIIIDPSPVGVGTTSGLVRIYGDLYVDGTQFSVNSSDVNLGDFTISIASSVGTNLLLDGAGIGIGSTNIRKFITWQNSSSSLKTSENWKIGDNKSLIVGDGNDLQIYHDGSDSYIDDQGEGNLILKSNFIDFTSPSGLERYAYFQENSAVALYFNGSKKFETTAYGIDVTGTTGTDQLNVSGVSTFSDETNHISGLSVGTKDNHGRLWIADGGASGGTRYGFTPQFQYNVVLVNEQGSTNQALFLGDTSDGSSGDLFGISIGTGTNDTTGTETWSPKLVLKGNGSLGIGTGLPEYKLDLGQISPSTIRLVSGNNGTAIRVGSGGDDNDVTLLRVDGTSTSTRYLGESDVGALGFSIKYMGSRTGNNNSLSIFGDNGSVDGASSQVEAITILQDGNVGIGSTIPTYKLDVSGDIFYNNSAIISSDAGGGIGGSNIDHFWHNDAGSYGAGGQWNFVSDGTYKATGNSAIRAGAFANMNDTGTASQKLQITGGAYVSGNVGIAQTNPQYPLDVTGSIRTTGSLFVDFGIYHDGDTNTSIQFPSNDNIKFVTSGLERLRIKGDGNVGIGTDNPTHRLTVDGSGTANTGTTIARFRNSNSQNRIDIIDETATGTLPPGILSPSAAYGLGLYAGGGPIRFYPNSTSTEKVRIDNSGNLLINTTSATGTSSQPLQVSGGAYVSGNLGVGVTNPVTKLEVNGIGRFTNNGGSLRLVGTDHTYIEFYPDGVSAGRKGYFGYPAANIDDIRLENQISNANINLLPTGSGSVLINTTSATGTSSQPLQVSGGAYVSGNVGIGRTNPSVLLHLTGGSAIGAIVERNSSGESHIRYQNTSGTMHAGISTGATFWGISDDANLTEEAHFVVSRTSGNVGINSSSPTAKLDVNGDVAIASTVGIGTRIDLIPYDTIDNGTLSFEGSAGQLFSITNNLTSGSIFSVNDVSGIPSIDVDADGTILIAPYGGTEYVGIGTTNPTAKLDVNGTVNVSGNATFQGNVDLGDNDSLYFGDGNDLQIYHDSTNTYLINNAGSVYLRNRADDQDVIIQSDDGSGGNANYIVCDGSTGEVTLSHYGNSKLSTTSSGVSVTGDVTLTSELNFSGPTAKFVDFYTKDSGGTAYGAYLRLVNHDSTSFHSAINMIRDGAVELYHNNNKKLETTGIGVSIIGVGNTATITGPSNLVLDPAAVGDNTGTVTILGNLQVDGTQTVINSTTMTVDDLNITLASGAANASAANGAGITVDGASATLTYASSGDNWVFNKAPYYNTDRLLTTADEGTGNGLDADTLDGLQATSFLRSDAADTASGVITFSSGNTNYGTSTALSAEFGVNTSAAGAIKLHGTSFNAYGLIQATTNNLHIDASSGTYLNYYNGSFISFGTGAGAESARFTGSTGTLTLGTTTATGTASQPLQVSGGAYVSGNLGIGVTNPTSKLDVVGGNLTVTNPIGGINIRSGTNTDYSVLTLGRTSTDNTIAIPASAGQWANNAAAGDLVIRTEVAGGKIILTNGATNSTLAVAGNNVLIGSVSSTGTSSQPLQVTGGAYVSGNLGIGVTNPTNPLTVKKDATVPSLGLRSGNNSGSFTNAAQIAFGWNGSDDYQHFIHTRHNSGNSDNAIDFYVCDGTQDNTVTSGSIHTMSLVSGYVGINSTAPTAKLDVNGDVAIASTVSIGTTIDIIPYNDLGMLSFEGSQGQLFAITNNLSSGSIFSVNPISGIPIIDVHADRTIQLNPYGGNTGIGTTNPSDKLHVQGDIRIDNPGAATEIKFGTDTDNVKLFRSNGTFDLNLLQGHSSNDGLYLGSGGNVYVSIDTNNNDNDTKAFIIQKNALQSGTELARFTESGRLGIGTDSPSDKLDVWGSIRASQGSQQYIKLHPVGGAGYYDVSNTTSYPSIVFRQIGSGGTQERMRIDSDGDVGIGTDAPTQKLDVNGNIRLRGAIYDSLNSAGTSGQILVSNAGAGVTWTNLTAIPVGDANTLDGLDSTSFLRSDQSDTMTGNLTMGTNYIYGDLTTTYLRIGGTPAEFVTVRNMEIRADDDNSATNEYLLLAAGLNELKVTSNAGSIDNNKLTYNGNVVWHAGNDGTGSTLDADLLDGNEGSYYRSADNINAGTLAIARGGTNSSATPTNGGVAYGTGSAYAFTSAGTSGYVLTSNGAAAPTWQAAAATGVGIATEGGTVGTGVTLLDFRGAGISTITESSGIATINITGGGSALTVKQIQGNGGTEDVSVSAVNTLIFDANTGFNVTDNGSGEVFVDLGSSFAPWYVDGEDDLIPDGEESIEIVAGPGIAITTKATATGIGTGLSKALTITSTVNGASITNDTTTNSTFYVGFTNATTGDLTTLNVSNTGLTFNPSTGNLVAGGTVTASSDEKLKININTIENALDKVLSLRGVEFDRIDTGEHQLGVIAQEVEKIVPDVVYPKNPEKDDELKSVAYGNLIGLLIEAIKEQNVKILELERKLQEK